MVQPVRRRLRGRHRTCARREPERRLLLSWEFDAQWRPDADRGLRGRDPFHPRGIRRTRVELEHRNFERMGKDGGRKMRGDVEGGWPTRLELYAKEVAAEAS